MRFLPPHRTGGPFRYGYMTPKAQRQKRAGAPRESRPLLPGIVPSAHFPPTFKRWTFRLIGGQISQNENRQIKQHTMGTSLLNRKSVIHQRLACPRYIRSCHPKIIGAGGKAVEHHIVVLIVSIIDSISAMDATIVTASQFTIKVHSFDINPASFFASARTVYVPAWVGLNVIPPGSL